MDKTRRVVQVRFEVHILIGLLAERTECMRLAFVHKVDVVETALCCKYFWSVITISSFGLLLPVAMVCRAAKTHGHLLLSNWHHRSIVTI